MRYVRKSFFWGSIIILFAAVLQAQPAVIKNFTISVWPEYDHPGVLVIFNGRMNNQDLPTNVVFPVPDRARFALVAGSTDTTADRMIPIQIQDGTTGKEIRFPVVQPEFHVEFYYNPFQEGSTHRHYTYDFASNLRIDSLIVLLQQPMTAQSFQAGIPVDQQLQDNHGIKYYQTSYENVAPGKNIHMEAQYENPQGQLTTEALQAQLGGSQGATESPEGATTGSKGPSIWLMFIVVALVAGVLFFITKSRPKPVPESAGSGKASPSKASSASKDQSKDIGHKFCIHCGESIPEDAKFCTKCGKAQSG